MLGVEKGSLHALTCCRCKKLQESLRLNAMLRLLQTIVDEFACRNGKDLCGTDMYAHTAKGHATVNSTCIYCMLVSLLRRGCCHYHSCAMPFKRQEVWQVHSHMYLY